MSRRLLVPGAALVVAVSLAVVAFTRDESPVTVDASRVDASATPGPTVPDAASSPSSEAPAPTPTPSVDPDQPSLARMAPLRIDPASGLAIGDPDAPMVMVTFESFGCLWCGMFHRLTMPMVMEDWVDTGLLRIETRIMPYEPRAFPGARIAAAAARQDRYWELAQHLYPFIAGDGEAPVGRDLTDDELSAYRVRQTEEALLAQAEAVADEIDLDMDRLRADMADDVTTAIVERDQQVAWQLGFTGTPAFIVNGVPQGGFAGPEAFATLLAAVLDASEG